MFEYFWLFCGAWVAGGSFIQGKLKSKSLIESGEFSREDVNKYLRNFSIIILVPCITFWLIQQSVGPNAEIGFMTWPNPQKAIALTILISLWSSLLVWVLFLGGAKSLARFVSLLGSVPKTFLTQTNMKIFVILLVASGTTSLFMQPV
jgi:hypothetical protein